MTAGIDLKQYEVWADVLKWGLKSEQKSLYLVLKPHNLSTVTPLSQPHFSILSYL